MGKASRDKGARGERRCCDYFERLGLPAYRVSSLETDPASPVNYDVRLGSLPWRVQVKEVADHCPALPRLMENANVGFVHYTRGRTFVVIDADDLPEFAKMVAAGKAE